MFAMDDEIALAVDPGVARPLSTTSMPPKCVP